MLYPPEFPSLGFFVFVYSSSFLQSISLESYASSLIALSVQTPDTMLAVPCDTKVKPALETPGDLSGWAVMRGRCYKNVFGKSLQLFVLLFHEENLYVMVCKSLCVYN